jgi:hypothetical protein
MRLRAIASAIASWLLMTINAQAGSLDLLSLWSSLSRFEHAAYFSDVCRQRAEAMGLSGMTNVDALLEGIALFGRGAPDAPRALMLRDYVRRDDCDIPAILLVNLLRSNGLDAELVLRCSFDGPQIGRMYVYVPARDRYIDPAGPIGQQGPPLDLKIRGVHLRRGSSPDYCPDVCMGPRPRSGGPVGEPFQPVRVKTETIRIR